MLTTDFHHFPLIEEIKQKGEILIWGDKDNIIDYVLVDVENRIIYNFDGLLGGRRFVFCFNGDWQVETSWCQRSEQGTSFRNAFVLNFIPVLNEFLSHIREQVEDKMDK